MANVTHKYAQTTGPTGSATSYRYSPLVNADGTEGSISATLAIGTDNLTDGDLWNFMTLPSNFIITDVILNVDDLDSNGAPALDIRVKANDGTSTTDISNADDTVAQAGGISKPTNGLPLGNHAAAVTVYVEVITTAATAQAGNATLTVKGFYDQN